MTFELQLIQSNQALAARLGYRLASLEQLAAEVQAGLRFSPRTVKVRGRHRDLLVPDDSLKYVLREIAELLALAERQFPAGVHGFVRTRSNVTNARAHGASKYLQSFDLKDFFDNVTADMVYHALGALGIGASPADLITRLAVVENRLPQGSPASPSLSNLVLLPVDEELQALALECGARYSRFADDLAFTSSEPFDVSSGVASIVKTHGFELNTRKSRSFASGQPLFVTGLYVGRAEIGLRKRFKRNLRLELFMVEKHGLGTHASHRNSPEHVVRDYLSGRLHYAMQVDAAWTARLSQKYPVAWAAVMPRRDKPSRTARLAAHRRRVLEEIEQRGLSLPPFREPMIRL